MHPCDSSVRDLQTGPNLEVSVTCWQATCTSNMLYERDWWMTDYATDIAETMRQSEKKINKFYAKSPQLDNRHFLVNWLSLVGESLELRTATIHLAVFLLDYFMESHDLSVKYLKLVAASCLLIAAKFEDQDSSVPRIGELNAMFDQPNDYTAKQYMDMELLLLKFFDWNIMVPTVPHFVDYFATEALTGYDLSAGPPIVVCNISKESVWYYIKYFMDISLQDVVFLRYPRSLVAAACIASMRLYLMLSPKWTTSLHKITRYSWDQLQSCIEIMLRALEVDEEATRRKRSRKSLYEGETASDHRRAIANSPASPDSSMSLELSR